MICTVSQIDSWWSIASASSVIKAAVHAFAKRLWTGWLVLVLSSIFDTMPLLRMWLQIGSAAYSMYAGVLKHKQ
jgi:Na+/H+ antiporter NhaD/arsenite permease-like protein